MQYCFKVRKPSENLVSDHGNSRVLTKLRDSSCLSTIYFHWRIGLNIAMGVILDMKTPLIPTSKYSLDFIDSAT